MKKIFIIIFSVLIVFSVFGFLWSQYIQKQKTEARANIDATFNLIDVTKDYLDEFKSCLDVSTYAKLNDGRQFMQANDIYDQSEKAFKDGEYSKAINLAHESANLTTEFRNQFDTVVIPRKTANLCN
ncbi:MAG: hypothetical protein PHH40_02580 [Candidatus Moranbacteria bacterium]|nr:hypothetical protein [Candidatus Moranbacteria bacterium]MDD3965217.1 hypothetical protein [Candidatus Moranbacteria bacterium]